MEEQKKELKQELLELDKEKLEIEKGIEETTAGLLEYKGLGYEKNNNLVDDEGFPSEDLDYGKLKDYRILKKKENELLNDHKDIMKKIGLLQEKYFSMTK